MQLHQLQSTHPRKYAQPPIGRGGKRGNTSGRGQKGQKSRSGHRIRPAERDLIIRLPKLRGYKNKPLKDPAQVVHLGDIALLTESVITRALLCEKGLLRYADRPTKVLADGKCTRPIILQGFAVSASARKAIEACGGKIES